jgi:hypothetical protein
MLRQVAARDRRRVSHYLCTAAKINICIRGKATKSPASGSVKQWHMAH